MTTDRHRRPPLRRWTLLWIVIACALWLAMMIVIEKHASGEERWRVLLTFAVIGVVLSFNVFLVGLSLRRVALWIARFLASRGE